MTITGISNNVQALLTDTDKFVTVLPAAPDENTNFAGYPAACHYYVDATSEYATVSQNRRVYEYVVELYIVPDQSTSQTDLFLNETYPLIDEIMQMFDESIDLSSTELGLARACDIMRPTPSELVRVKTPEGAGMMMTLRLFCEADKTFRN